MSQPADGGTGANSGPRLEAWSRVVGSPPAATGSLFGHEIVRAWTDAATEYRRIRAGAAVLASPWETLLVVSGRDHRAFLQALLTQDVGALRPGRCLPAALADRQGHLQADLWVLDLGHALALRLRADRREAVLRLLDRHRITEQVSWEAQAAGSGSILLLGPGAPAALSRLGISYVEGVTEGGTISPLGLPGHWMRVRETCPAEFLLVPMADALEDLLIRIVSLSEPPVPVGWDAFNLARIEAGSPWFGLDGDETRLVPEFVPEDRISYAKGCFLGQETIARAHYVGRLNWHLKRIRIETQTVPEPGSDILEERGDRAGWTASAAIHPDGGVLALAYLHRRVLEGRGPLHLVSGAEVRMRDGAEEGD